MDCKLTLTSAIAIFLICFVPEGLAQHDHHPPTKPTTTKKATTKMTQKKSTKKTTDTIPKDQKSHPDHDMFEGQTMNMSHYLSLNLPMNRNGSGTGWLPDASPMYGYMIHTKRWMFMGHGNIFIRYNNQDIGNKGSRGDEKWDAPNWFMFMGQRKVGQRGLFHFSSMFSLDAVIAGKTGYPLLFQTGETANGKPLVDRQHPHDLFSELSVSYSHAISSKADVFAYFAYPGEPALGSVAFMHRPSALTNPDAPLSHHWNDGTHITFGVATIGARFDKFKIEGSSFTGREPDEDRYNFDKPRFDSWSGRLSFNPTKNWSLQVSHGFVKSPEVLHPDEDVNRTTASGVFSKELPGECWINITGLWGMNKIGDHDPEHAVLVEGSWNKKKLALYGRYEWVQKSTEELALDETVYGVSIFPVNAITLGFNYRLLEIKNTWLSAGSHFTFFAPDRRLNELYGNNPLSFEVYLRINPAIMKM